VPTFRENYLCARSAFSIQSRVPNLKSLAQVVIPRDALTAKRGLAITCLSVTLVVFENYFTVRPIVSVGRSLSADASITGLLQEEQLEILAQSDPPPVDLSVGDIRSQIAAEWLQIAQHCHNGEHIGNYHRSSNGAIADPLQPPLLPKWGSNFHMPPIKIREWPLSPQRVIRSTSCLVLE